MGLYFRVREKVRSIPWITRTIYLAQGLYLSYFGRLARDIRRNKKAVQTAKGVALCLRFRDEGRYLVEWLEYYRAAGIDHFFLYDNFSIDGYQAAIQPWIDAGLVTLVRWEKVPASPSAEEDCICRALGHFAWVGFVDADEFVVIRNGESVGEFLEQYQDAPGVALHWRFYGSGGHRIRPDTWVIDAYQQRGLPVNRHVKTFVQPHRVTQCRNSHAWFYFSAKTAVSEHRNKIYGSFGTHPSADQAWINHYYCKSEEDYREKMLRSSTLDNVGIKFPTRREEKLVEEMQKNNEAYDPSAAEYYRSRCEAIKFVEAESKIL